MQSNRVAPTAPPGDSSKRVANTEFVTNAISGFTPLPVASATGSVIYWNGTAWVALAGNASGTAFLSETASGVPSWATISLSGLFLGVSDFTAAGTFTATIATGATKGFVRLWAAQGGNDSTSSLAGGGGGYLEKLLIGLTAGSTLALTLGTAGVDGTTAQVTAGGTSILASGSQTISTLTAFGGGGGGASAPGAGGTATGGDLNITGQAGSFIEAFATTPQSGKGVTGGGFTGPGGCAIEWYT